jgi:tripartite-type tricarboxylate transporter receptor subunit TctC
MTAFVFVIAVMVLLVPEISRSQDYPSRPIRLIVSSAPGGAPDISSRELANELMKQMHQQVVVENRPGAGMIIGLEALKRATPDGYTFAFVGNLIATNPSLFAKLPYDFERDFRPLIFYSQGFAVLTVAPSLPVRSAKELIDHARAKPDKLKYGSVGIGGPAHLSMELFKTMTNTVILNIAYKGSQQAITDLMGGQIDIVCDNLSSTLPYVQSGRVRALAVTSLKRLAQIPELPTLHESGVPGYEFSAWGGFAVPVGVAPNLIQRLNSEINKALTSPTISNAIALRAATAVGGTPEKFGEHVRSETERLGKLIKSTGIKPQ